MKGKGKYHSRGNLQAQNNEMDANFSAMHTKQRKSLSSYDKPPLCRCPDPNFFAFSPSQA